MRSMTNLGDVIRQVETALCDPHHPPTQEQREVLNTILFSVYCGAVETYGSR